MMKYLNFKTLGILAVAGGIAYQLGNDIASKIGFTFKSFKFVNFWANLKKLQLECQATFSVTNYNTFDITVLGFLGDLTYKKEKVTAINLVKDVPLVTNQTEEMTFYFKTNLLKAAAKLFLAFTDRNEIEGGMIRGRIRVKIYGVSFGIPYSQAINISL